MRRTVLYSLGAIVVVALVAGVAARLRGSRGAAQAATKRIPDVLVELPQVCDVDVTLDLPVDVQPVEQAGIASKQSGYLRRVLVDRGDHVHRGQLMAVVDPADLADVQQQLEAQAAQARAQLALARSNAERGRDLFKHQFISGAELDQLEAQLAGAQASLEAAQQAARAAETRVAETDLTAPFDGFITDRLADPGVLLTGGPNASPILSLARLDPVRVFLHIDEAHAAQVQLGQPVTLTVDALPGRAFAGKVLRFSPALDLATRTETVEVQVPNPGTPPLLRSGMFGRARLRIGRLRGARVLPAEAVLVDGPERWVYVVRTTSDGTVARRADVAIGFDAGDALAVTSGLAAGDRVIVRGVDLVGDGTPVQESAVGAGRPALCASGT